MERKGERNEHETIQVPNHSFVEVSKGDLSVARIHDDVEEDAVEGQKRLEVVVGNEVGDVAPYFVREGQHGKT